MTKKYWVHPSVNKEFTSKNTAAHFWLTAVNGLCATHITTICCDSEQNNVKLESLPVVSTCGSHASSMLTSVTEPMQNVKKKFDLDLWPFDCKVNAHWGPAMDYRYTECGVDSSSHLPFRAQTEGQTDKQTDRCNWMLYPPLATIQLAWDNYAIQSVKQYRWNESHERMSASWLVESREAHRQASSIGRQRILTLLL